jgi:hypothetical protein
MADLQVQSVNLISPYANQPERRTRALVKARAGRKTRLSETGADGGPQDGYTDDYMELHAVFASVPHLKVGDYLTIDLDLDLPMADGPKPDDLIVPVFDQNVLCTHIGTTLSFVGNTLWCNDCGGAAADRTANGWLFEVAVEQPALPPSAKCGYARPGFPRQMCQQPAGHPSGQHSESPHPWDNTPEWSHIPDVDMSAYRGATNVESRLRSALVFALAYARGVHNTILNRSTITTTVTAEAVRQLEEALGERPTTTPDDVSPVQFAAGTGSRHQWCRYSGPGRGDCANSIGLPVDGFDPKDPNVADVYGIPHGWCDYCWMSHQNAQLEQALTHMAEAVVSMGEPLAFQMQEKLALAGHTRAYAAVARAAKEAQPTSDEMAEKLQEEHSKAWDARIAHRTERRGPRRCE